jgi:hypothetical protein
MVPKKTAIFIKDLHLDMEVDDQTDDQDVQQSTTPMLRDYREVCVFHACFLQAKTFQEMVEFMYNVHEQLIFNVTHMGITMKADDRPTGNRTTGQKETIFTDLFIPVTGFSNWFYAAEDPDSVTPIPVEATDLRESLKGSILVKESLILYILKSDVDTLHARVVGVDKSTYKVDSATTLIKTDTLSQELLEPITAPYYDLNKPVATFANMSLASACKDAKTAKVSQLCIAFHKAGIVISFEKASGGKTYPLGVINHAQQPVFTAFFKVKKKFETLVKLNKLCKHVSVYASQGKPVLFSFNIHDTGGKFNVYCVPIN